MISVILTVVIALVLVAGILWLVNTFIPMEPRLKSILNTFVIVFAVICIGVWLLTLVFGSGRFHDVPIPRL